MTKISPLAHNYSINTLGGEELTATETGCHLYPAHASKDYFKSFLAQGKISPRNKFKGWVFQMPHHSGKYFEYWKWPNQSYFLGNALPMGPLQHNFSPVEGTQANLSMVHTALFMHKQEFSSTPLFTTSVQSMTKGPAVPWWFLTWSHQCREYPTSSSPAAVSDAAQVLIYQNTQPINQRGFDTHLVNHSQIKLFKQISGNHNYSIQLLTL